MYNGENPHIVSTENTLFIDENGNVIPNPYDTGYDEPAEVSYRRRIGVLERDEAELLEKIDALCKSPKLTEKQKLLVEEYRKSGGVIPFWRRLRYRSIREDFIEPYRKLEAKLSDVRDELERFRRLYLSATTPLSPETIERYRKILHEETEGDSK